MATAFQNRLVGTIIIVALAVIFLPEFLDGEKRHSQDRFESIPDRPQMKQIVEPEEFPFQQVQDAVTRKVEVVADVADDDASDASSAQQTSSAQTTASTQQSTEIQTDSGSEPVMEPKKERVEAGWVVQLGTFRHQKNVKELLRKLEQAGYRTFSRQVQTSAGSLTKVFVGPDVKRENMENAIPHLKEVTGLQGRLTPFTVQ